MNWNDLKELGVAGISVIVLGYLFYCQLQNAKEKDKLIRNHLEHTLNAQIEESKAKIKQATALQRLADVIDKKLK